MYIFSNSFERRGSSEIGLLFFGTRAEPFLKSGFNYAILHCSGNTELLIERFISCATGCESSVVPSFRNLPPRLSNPTALDGSIFCSNARTVSSVVCVKPKFLFSRFKCL